MASKQDQQRQRQQRSVVASAGLRAVRASDGEVIEVRHGRIYRYPAPGTGRDSLERLRGSKG